MQEEHYRDYEKLAVYTRMENYTVQMSYSVNEKLINQYVSQFCRPKVAGRDFLCHILCTQIIKNYLQYQDIYSSG
jgi:hypothetical protein